jgi:hypothetical protein
MCLDACVAVLFKKGGREISEDDEELSAGAGLRLRLR